MNRATWAIRLWHKDTFYERNYTISVGTLSSAVVKKAQASLRDAIFADDSIRTLKRRGYRQKAATRRERMPNAPHIAARWALILIFYSDNPVLRTGLSSFGAFSPARRNIDQIRRVNEATRRPALAYASGYRETFPDSLSAFGPGRVLV